MLSFCYAPVSVRSFSCTACRNFLRGSAARGLSGAQLLEKFGYPAPLFLTYLIASLETFGGVLLVVGLFVRPVALAMVIFMLFAVHYTSVNSGFIWVRGGCEYPLTILLISFYYLINGAGPLSIASVVASFDRAIGTALTALVPSWLQ